MPKRRGRNEDPVGKHAKAARVAEAKATKRAKAENEQKRAAETEAAKDKLTEMEIDESFVRTEEDQQRIRRLSDMEAMTDGEKPDGLEDEAEESSDDLEGLEIESESLAGNETGQSRKRAPKVSFGLNTIQVRILMVTSRKTRRLGRS